jgi:hypothetical protein
MQRQCDIAHVAHCRQRMPRWAVGGPLPEIGTRTELAPGAGDDHDAIVGIPTDLTKGVAQLGPHRARRCVLLRRPVEQDGDDAAVTGDLDGFHVWRRY